MPRPTSKTGSAGTRRFVFFDNLAAGNYIVQAAKAGSNPPLQIDLFAGRFGSSAAEIGAPVPVPEPGSAALVALGLLALEVEALRRRGHHAG